MKRLHHFDDRDIRAVVDELVICFSSVGPAPRVGEGVKLRLAHLSARLPKEDIVIGIRIKRRIEIDKIDTGVGKFLPIRKPFQVIAKYNRFIDEMNSNPAVAGDSARNDNWVQRHAARRNTADSLDNDKSEQPARDKVIVVRTDTSKGTTHHAAKPGSIGASRQLVQSRCRFSSAKKLARVMANARLAQTPISSARKFFGQALRNADRCAVDQMAGIHLCPLS